MQTTDRSDTEKAKTAMLAALESSLGVVTTAARMAHIHRDTHYTWLKEDPDYKQKVDELKEIALDFVETAQFNEIRNGNATLIIWYLKTKGRQRGYIEKQEIVLDTDQGVDLEWRITKRPKVADDHEPDHRSDPQ